MNYYFDTEFHEYKKNGVDTIELISIGIVAEDGREYYAVCNEFDVHAAMNNEWLCKNVLRPIHNELEGVDYTSDHYGSSGRQIAQWNLLFESDKTKSRETIAKEVIHFCSVNSGYSDFEHPDKSNVVFWLNRTEDVEEELKHKGITTVFEGTPKFYAYFADYDWVVFCWLFGRMMDLPGNFPMYCRDLKQSFDEIQEPHLNSTDLILSNLVRHPDYPKQKNEHNALADARWNKELHEFIKSVK